MVKLSKKPSKTTKQVIEQASAEAIAQIHEGMALQKKGELELARACYRKVLAQHPNQVDALHLAGALAYQQQEFKEAVELIQKAVELKPNFTAALNNLGLALVGLGEYERACEHYTNAITLAPTFAEAFYNRGIALFKQQRYEKALSDFESAIKLKPDYASAYFNLGNCQKELMQTEAALASYQKAVEHQPNMKDALLNSAVICMDLKRYDQAQILAEQLITLIPEHAEAHNLLSIALHKLGQNEEALKRSSRAIELSPNSPEAHNTYGAILEALGKNQEALVSFEKAVTLNPNYGNSYHNLALLQHKLNEFDKALCNYEKAILLKPNDPNIYYDRGRLFLEKEMELTAIVNFDVAIQRNPVFTEALTHRGHALKKNKSYNSALEDYRKVAELVPGKPQTIQWIGQCYYELGKHSEAIEHVNKAIALAPDQHDLYLDRGIFTYNNLASDLAKAKADFFHALTLRPDDAFTLFNLSLLELLLGDFEAGWKNYDSRLFIWNVPNLNMRRKTSTPEWRGLESLKGKTILLKGEQGLGDCIQFSRYVPLLADKGAKVILDVPSFAVSVLKNITGIHRIISYEDPLPEFDYHCSLLSLPLALNTNLETIPPVAGPIALSAETLQTWGNKIHERFPNPQRPKVGLVWSGSTKHKKDHNRSIPLKDFINYLPEECDYICLQKEIRASDKIILESHTEILTLEKEIEDFLDTSALCMHMDLIISVDTSVAHLAGTLQKKVLVLLPSHPDWRWLRSGDTTPWYPTMNLIRQETDESWSEPLGTVQNLLQQFRMQPKN